MVVKNPAVVSPLPVIEWFMEDAVYNDILANHRYDDYQGAAVLAYDGVVYDNALMSVRGNSSRSMTKVSWKVEMPKGHELDMGSKLPYTLDEFAIQRDPDAYADLVVGDGRGGRRARACRSRPCARSATVSSGASAGSWRPRTAPGARRRASTTGRSTRATAARSRRRARSRRSWRTSGSTRRRRKSEDYSDVWNLSQKIDAAPSAAQKEWMYQNINIPEVINYMAINSVIRHNDSGWYNWFIARDTEGTGRWELWHWDLDYTFTTPARDGKGTFLTPDTSNKLTQAVLAYPDWKEMFYPTAPHARRPVPRPRRSSRTSGTRSPRRTPPTGSSTSASGAASPPPRRAAACSTGSPTAAT